MQFQVPQFTDIEDKIIGPLTLKQFLYLLAGGVIIFIFFKLFNIFVVFLLGVPVACISFALAFVRVNNQPFIEVVKNFFGFLRKPDFYVWKKPIAKTPSQEQPPQIIEKTPIGKKIKPIAKEKLQEINWKIEVEK